MTMAAAMRTALRMRVIGSPRKAGSPRAGRSSDARPLEAPLTLGLGPPLRDEAQPESLGGGVAAAAEDDRAAEDRVDVDARVKPVVLLRHVAAADQRGHRSSPVGSVAARAAYSTAMASAAGRTLPSRGSLSMSTSDSRPGDSAVTTNSARAS